jgi:hypothetical protein
MDRTRDSDFQKNARLGSGQRPNTCTQRSKRSIGYARHTTPPLDARRCFPVHVDRTDGARFTRHSYSVLSIPPHVIGLIRALHHKGARDGCRATAQRARAHPATADGLRRLLVLVQAPPPPSGPCDARNRNAPEGKRGGGGRRAGVGTDACTWEGARDGACAGGCAPVASHSRTRRR